MGAVIEKRIPRLAIVAGFSSQPLAEEIAAELGSKVVTVTRKQFNDKEIQTTIEENVRGLDVVVIASASGDPNKQEKEARMLMRAANRAGAKKVTLVLPYIWNGRSDDIWDERNSPALIDTIETLRDHCASVVVADPHNAGLTREKFLDKGSPVKNCTIVHFAFPFAIQLKGLVDAGIISKGGLFLAHADAGSTKRISRSFRACLYNILGFVDRSPDQDDWAQGLKDRDKKTGKIKIKGFSADVAGKDVVIFEDMIAGGGTANDLAALLKTMGARSIILFATTGLFSTDIKKGESPVASVERINQSQVDAVFITDTFNHSLTDPEIHKAIEASPIIHTIRTAPYFAAIIRALLLEVDEDMDIDRNSVSAILKGTHPDQLVENQKIAFPVPYKAGSPLLALKASRARPVMEKSE
jgi:ribose-phosphate pyrophosphokinase